METPPQFDLSKAIEGWREKLASSPAIDSEGADELEQHLRESVTALKGKGLAAHEAFWVARSRLGTHDALDLEYGKIHPEQVWTGRVLWMVVGWFAVSLGSSLLSGLATFTTLGMFKLGIPLTFLGPASLVLHIATVVAWFLLLWRSGSSRDGRVWWTARWLRARPLSAGATALVFTVLSSAGSMSAQVLASKIMPMETYSSLMWWRFPAGIVAVLLWAFVLVWLLARKPHRQSLCPGS